MDRPTLFITDLKTNLLYIVSASKHGVVQNSSISAIMPTSLFEALFSVSLHLTLFWQFF